MSVHIGEKIKARAKELRIGPTELGIMINTSKQNVYGIYKRKTVDAELLKQLSVALKFDFFDYYYDKQWAKAFNEEQASYYKTGKNGVTRKNELANLKKELEELKEKYELLQRLYKLTQEYKPRTKKSTKKIVKKKS